VSGTSAISNRALQTGREPESKNPDSPNRRERLVRAEAAAEQADRIVDRFRHPSGAGFSAALDLYREATFWALTAALEGPLPATLAEAFARVSPGVLAPIGNETWRATARGLLESSFVATAELGGLERGEQLRVVREFVRGVLTSIQADDRTIERAIRRRWAAIGVSAALALCVVGIVVAVLRHDLAANQPWRVSSMDPSCDSTFRVCGGQYVGIFFHTLEEASPWIEFDLGKSRAFSSVTITNRQDCCKARAVPLVIEVSNDQTSFTEVSRRDDVFDTWKATFAPVSARFVRARALRKTTLHFEGFSVR